MIDSNSESLLNLAEAARLLPRRRAGRKCSISTIYRWTTRGCRGVVLESVQIGATRCTSVEALGRFFKRLTNAATSESAADFSRRPPDRSRPDQIDAELDRLGLV